MNEWDFDLSDLRNHVLKMYCMKDGKEFKNIEIKFIKEIIQSYYYIPSPPPAAVFYY